MKQERTHSIEGKEYTLLISDEPQALLEAKASASKHYHYSQAPL